MSLLELSYSAKELATKRARLAEQFIESSPHLNEDYLDKLSILDLSVLLDLYDQEFFHNMWEQEVGTQLDFSLSTRMTRSAGKTIFKRRKIGSDPDEIVFEIRIGVNFFYQFNSIDRTKTVCGLPAPNALWALMLVFEHELCHVIEVVYYKTSNCSKKRFKRLANGLFGHTTSSHALPTTREVVYHERGLKVGDEVSFAYKQKQFRGVISAINKRATVMVPATKGVYVDKAGVRYNKYYVPLSKLGADPQEGIPIRVPK